MATTSPVLRCVSIGVCLFLKIINPIKVKKMELHKGDKGNYSTSNISTRKEGETYWLHGNTNIEALISRFDRAWERSKNNLSYLAAIARHRGLELKKMIWDDLRQKAANEGCLVTKEKRRRK